MPEDSSAAWHATICSISKTWHILVVWARPGHWLVYSSYLGIFCFLFFYSVRNHGCWMRQEPSLQFFVLFFHSWQTVFESHQTALQFLGLSWTLCYYFFTTALGVPFLHCLWKENRKQRLSFPRVFALGRSERAANRRRALLLLARLPNPDVRPGILVSRNVHSLGAQPFSAAEELARLFLYMECHAHRS